jgi:hypothetical protein
MRWLCLFAIAAVSLSAQLPAFNAAGISIGHIHLMLGSKIAFVLDPAGTRIELMEGVAAH